MHILEIRNNEKRKVGDSLLGVFIKWVGILLIIDHLKPAETVYLEKLLSNEEPHEDLNTPHSFPNRDQRGVHVHVHSEELARVPSKCKRSLNKSIWNSFLQENIIQDGLKVLQNIHLPIQRTPPKLNIPVSLSFLPLTKAKD